MNDATCTLCGNKHWIERNEKPIAWRSTFEKFSLFECTNCGVIKTFPEIKESEIHDYYNFQNYDSHAVTTKSESLFGFLYNQIRNINAYQKIKLLKRHIGNNKTFNLLDYGCGNGSFIETAFRNSIHAEGVEFDEHLVKSLKNNGKIVYSVNEFYSLQKTFDVISLFHVFEHLQNPNFNLELFRSKLKPNGLLVIALPNPDSYDCFYYSSEWAAWDVPIHYHHFRKDSIVQFVESNGFDILKIKPLYFDAFYISYLSEKIKKNKVPMFRGFLMGLYSNILAIKDGNYSSLLYVFKKN